MLPPDTRTLSGEVASSQHLAEIRLPADGLVLPHASSAQPEHLLLLCLKGPVTCTHADRSWILETNQFAWLSPLGATVLRSASKNAAELLVWHFQPAALPTEMHSLLAAPGAAPAHGPAPLTPSMQTLILALRSCPVSPVLRALWGTGKLIELLTLIIPPPADSPHSRNTSRVLHPALRAVLDFMAAHLSEPIGLTDLAEAAHSSPSHLSRLFTAEFGYGPTVHLRRLRLDHAAGLLRSGQANVTEAAFAAGYQSLGQFSRAFTEHHGKSPSALLPRNNG
ncbi:helix-turn-helix domain-containing protein [Rariglobus hedericola]|uniref:Helix-turn-helix transcriptional regulator n=1 Tax=Rariglobus hedericola TaxID=2597822 RepID=A0A556QKH7_9BACT|nr:AraC family transcriptional regulator [Rariglobus hedericola]TSJ77153.1 helix-turn-helix transcriptional regulator [Rariglobus hedericola]